MKEEQREELSDQLMKELGAGERGVVEFTDFKRWIQGSDSEGVRKQKAMERWQLCGKDAQEIKQELQQLMERDNIQVVDLFDKWDKDKNRALRKREFLIAMKLLFNDEDHWREHARAAVDEVWVAFSLTADSEVSAKEFDNWLSEGSAADREADRRAAARKRGARGRAPPTAQTAKHSTNSSVSESEGAASG
eukprot:3793046-Prymnesium_polylepis.1